jgi:hypothetical protein
MGIRCHKSEKVCDSNGTVREDFPEPCDEIERLPGMSGRVRFTGEIPVWIDQSPSVRTPARMGGTPMFFFPSKRIVYVAEDERRWSMLPLSRSQGISLQVIRVWRIRSGSPDLMMLCGYSLHLCGRVV